MKLFICWTKATNLPKYSHVLFQEKHSCVFCVKVKSNQLLCGSPTLSSSSDQRQFSLLLPERNPMEYRVYHEVMKLYLLMSIEYLDIFMWKRAIEWKPVLLEKHSIQEQYSYGLFNPKLNFRLFRNKDLHRF